MLLHVVMRQVYIFLCLAKSYNLLDNLWKVKLTKKTLDSNIWKLLVEYEWLWQKHDIL